MTTAAGDSDTSAAFFLELFLKKIIFARQPLNLLTH